MHKVVINTCFGVFSLSRKGEDWLNINYNIKPSEYLDLARHDPRLIECVETLGSEANGQFSELAVLKIPGNKYKIYDYDGYESVVIPEKIDWITITDE